MEQWGMSPISITNAYKPVRSIETAMQHVITLIQEAVENRKLHLSFPRY
jgi:anaerobic ribonucleoside-triphosphate reductase